MGADAAGLFRQGRALLDGGPGERERGFALLGEAGDLGHREACRLLGQLLEPDDPEGLSWLRRGAGLGDNGCQVLLAIRLLGGDGTPVDEAAAAELLQVAADSGHPSAAEWLTGLRRRQASRGRTLKASLDAAIIECGLDDYADSIRAAVAPSVRLLSTRTADERIGLGASKLGGDPDLDPEADWPRGPSGPLSFIGQADMADVVAHVAANLLPAGGLLSFFYDADEQPWGDTPEERSSWRVCYTAGTGSLHRRRTPDGVTRFPPVALTPRAEFTLPFLRTMEARVLDLDGDAWERYLDLREALDDFWPHYGGRAWHRMFGHADAIQGDMRRRIEATLRGGVNLDAGDNPELDQAARQWLLLLQVDSDDDADMMWGDAGRLFFWIPRSALAAADFSAVFVQLQC